MDQTNLAILKEIGDELKETVVEKTTENVLLLFLSKYNPNSKPEGYHGPEGKTYHGTQTNDAPLQYLMDQAEITKIFCIVSHEVYFNKIDIEGNSKTRYEYFKEQVAGYAENLAYNSERAIDIIPIFYDFVREDVLIKGDKTPFILQQLDREFTKLPGVNVYIDYTGGLRDMNFFTIFLIRLLEFQEISCKKIVYSDLFGKEIHNLDDVYNLFSLINGMSEFMTSGNARQLKLLAENIPDSIPSDQIKKLCKSIQVFSDSISICDINKIDDKWNEIEVDMNVLLTNNHKDIYNLLFKSLLFTMKKKLGFDKPELSVLSIIEWCTNNRLFQQAMTIFRERILSFFYSNNTFFKELWDNSREDFIEDNSFETFDIILSNNYAEYRNRYVEEEELSNFVNQYRKRLEEFNNHKDYKVLIQSLMEAGAAKNYSLCFSLLDNLQLKYNDIRIYNDPVEKTGLITILLNGNIRQSCFILNRSIENDEARYYSILIELLYYLTAIRRLRNRINHAGTEDYYKGNFSVEVVEEALRKAIDISKRYVR